MAIWYSGIAESSVGGQPYAHQHEADPQDDGAPPETRFPTTIWHRRCVDSNSWNSVNS